MPPALPQPQAVLDYASPRQRGKLRLPSRSVLSVSHDRDGVTVVETLSGKNRAFFAIAFAVLALGSMAVAFFSDFDPYSRHDRRNMGFQALLVGSVWVSGVTVMLLVVNNTWRRTVLRVHRDEVRLDFTAPFGRRHYNWSADAIEDVRVERTSDSAYTMLAELQLRPAASPIVHLFTDHPERDLIPLGAAVAGTLGVVARGSSMPDSAAATAAAPAAGGSPTPPSLLGYAPVIPEASRRRS